MAHLETKKDNLQSRLIPLPDQVAHRPSPFGHLQDISLAFAVVVIPLSILSLALLGVVLGFQIDTSKPTSLGPDQEPIAGYYIVDMSATTIVLIASYSSTIAPIAVGFAMTLLSYPIANDIIKYSERRQLDKLPTPYQLGLMINLRSGSIGSLWPWFKYTFTWRVRHKTAGVVKAFTLGVATALFLTLLVTLADTWIHLTTKSYEFLQIEPNSPTKFSYSRRAVPFCVDPVNQNSSYPCSVSEGSGQYYLADSGEGTRTLNNVSTLNQLITVYDSGLSYVILTDPQFLIGNVDFVASTIAINTQCTSISNECQLDGWAGTTVFYNCTPYFNGTLADAPRYTTSTSAGTDFKMTLFNDSLLMNPLVKGYYANTINPVWVAMVGVADGVTSLISANNTPMTDPTLVPANLTDSEVVTTRNGGFTFAFLCNSTTYDATYTWINGSFNNFTSLTVANQTIAKMINIPLQLNSFFGYPYFVSGTILSVFASSGQEVANKMAAVYSRTVLGLVTGAFINGPNLVEQTRQNILVALVPYGPFYTLIGINLICAALGMVMASIAFCRQRKVSNVIDLLSIWGVLAQAFEEVVPEKITVEHVEDLFHESRDPRSDVVGVEKVEGSGYWRFSNWTPAGQ